MPPITNSELRTMAYSLLRSSAKSLLRIEEKLGGLNTQLGSLKESISVATEIIERLEKEKHEPRD